VFQVFDKAAAAFKSEKDVVVAKVDADAHKELGSRYEEIAGVPMIVNLIFHTEGYIAVANG